MYKAAAISLAFLSIISVCWAHDQIYGVSLGGHLVPEPFIDAIFWDELNKYCPNSKDIWNVCECTVQNKASSEAVKKLFADHLSNFIDIDNLESKIQSTGINTIRYPISFTYFLRPFQDTYDYLKYESCGVVNSALQASSFKDVLTMLKANDVDVILDLHQGIGCQNGFDNGGHSGTIDFFNAQNVNATIQIWQNIVNYLKQENMTDLIWGFEVINEPLPQNSTQVSWLQTFTESVVNDILVPFMSEDQYLVLQPGPGNSKVVDYENYSLNISTDRVRLDLHEYIVFGNLILRTIPSRFSGIPGFASSSMGGTKFKYFVGEWSLATTDCAQYLDGAYGGYDPDYYEKLHQGHDTFYCNKVDQVRDNVEAGFQSCSVISTANETFPYCQLTDDLQTLFTGYTAVLCNLYQVWIEAFKTNPLNVGYVFWTFVTGENNTRQIQQWDFSWLVDNGAITNIANWPGCPAIPSEYEIELPETSGTASI